MILFGDSTENGRKGKDNETQKDEGGRVVSGSNNGARERVKGQVRAWRACWLAECFLGAAILLGSCRVFSVIGYVQCPFRRVARARASSFRSCGVVRHES